MTVHLLEYLYHNQDIQSQARQSMATDSHRKRLMARYNKITTILHSSASLSALGPMRQYQLSIITHKLSRNRAKHLHKAVAHALQSAKEHNTLSYARSQTTKRNHKHRSDHP